RPMHAMRRAISLRRLRASRSARWTLGLCALSGGVGVLRQQRPQRAMQDPVLPLDEAVALAGPLCEARLVEDADAAALVPDDSGALQLARRLGHADAAHA